MGVSAGFLEQVADALVFVPGYRTRLMFGGAGVYSGELMFAIAFEDTLWLRVDAASAPDFAARGLAPFVFRDRKGQETEMNYRQAPEEVFEDPDEARAWVERSIAVARRKKG